MVLAEAEEARSAAEHVTAVVELPCAWAVLFCVSTGLHLAPVLLLNGAICRQHVSGLREGYDWRRQNSHASGRKEVEKS